MKKEKNFLLFLIENEIKSGKNPAKISSDNNISKQKLNYYIRQLKDLGVIEKESYGVWKHKKSLKEVKKTTKASKEVKQIRGHAFNWKVKFKKRIDWEKRLINNKIKYQLIGINKTTPRIVFDGKKIWLTSTGLVIYEPKSFFSKSSFTSKGMAVWELDQTIKRLGKKLQINLIPYEFTTSREHYGMIKNELAKQYNDKGEKLYIKDDRGIWLWIDDSHSLNELETDKPKNSRGVQNWYNDMKKTNFEVTPSFVLNAINEVTQNQLMFNKNFESHVEAIRTLSSAVKELKEQIKTR